MRQIIINSDNENSRLDKLLMKYLNNASKGFIYKMLRKKNIKLNNKRAEGNELLKNGDVITLYLSDETLDTLMSERDIRKTQIKIQVVYEDNNIILCNKPVGVLSQGDGSRAENINDAILSYLYEKGEYDASAQSTFKPGLSNRLDRNTGGIVAMGKTLSATTALNEAFKNKGVEKLYITVVKGVVKHSGSVCGWYYRGKDNRSVFYKNRVENASYIETYYRPLAVKNGYTLLEVKLGSGKTHQIRVSMEFIQFPLVGDIKYSGSHNNPFGLKHQFLYAYKLGFCNNKGVLEYLNGKCFEIEYDNTMKRITDYFKDE